MLKHVLCHITNYFSKKIDIFNHIKRKTTSNKSVNGIIK